MKEIKAYIRPHMLDRVIDALEAEPDRPGVTISEVRGFGHASGGGPARMTERTKLEIVVSADQVQTVVDLILRHARTGKAGDGKIFVSDVERAVRVSTGEGDEAAVRPRSKPPSGSPDAT